MRLVFVHGINQDARDRNELKRIWVTDLEKGMGRPGALAATDIVMPFYGDALVEAANLGAEVVPQGAGGDESRDFARFLAEGLEEQALAAGVTHREIAAAQERDPPVGDVVPQGFPMDRRINAIVGLLERISPLHGELALRLLGQAYAYLKLPNVRRAVDDIVRPALRGDRMVIVAHSLGTVVAFIALREFAGAGEPTDVPLLVTMGSPLGIASVQRAAGPAFANPRGVQRWINLRDPDDIICLNRGLTPPGFGGPIDNIGDYENPGADAHAIPGYLRNSVVAAEIAAALEQ